MRADGRDEWTQPGGWRRADWLIVAAASFALIVLVFTTVRLAGPDRRIGRIDAFPGPPTGGLLTPQQPSTGVPAASPTASSTRGGSTTEPVHTAPDDGRPTVLEAPSGARPGERGPTGNAGPEATTRPAAASSTSSSPGVAEVEPDVVDLTYRFFGFLPDDPLSAWQMLSQQGQLQGYDEFSQQWQQYSDVDLLYVTVGADGSTVVAAVGVAEYKGETSQQRWKLSYQFGETVVIDEVTMLESGPQDPGGNKPFQ